MEWFPRPSSPADLLVVETTGHLDASQLFELLTSPLAEELQHKVGVSGSADGSAKASTRLLATEDWILKTNIQQAEPEAETITRTLSQQIETGRGKPIWHPAKAWFAMMVDNQWYPVTACAKLVTLRELPELGERIKGWSRSIELAARISVDHNIGLDINPANFGLDPQGQAVSVDRNDIYYLDDETYSSLSLLEIGEAVVSRIPEEPEADLQVWTEWGQALQSVIAGVTTRLNDILDFTSGINSYPLTKKFYPQRAALIEGFSVGNQLLTSRKKPSKKDKLKSRFTCVFADVHGNLPALEAILKDAKKHSVDSYLFLGDAVGYGPWPRECIARIAELEASILIRGNHDHIIGGDLSVEHQGLNRHARESATWTSNQITDSDREWLTSLPVEYVNGNFVAVHGAPQDPHKFFAYVYEMTFRNNFSFMENNQQNVCFYAHTHVQFAHRRQPGTPDPIDSKLSPAPLRLFEEGNRYLINPGSVGQPRDGDPRSAYAVWDRESNIVMFHRVKYPIEKTIAEIHRVGLSEDLALRLEIGR